MKKLSMTLVVALLTIGLIACGENEEVDEEQSEDSDEFIVEIDEVN